MSLFKINNWWTSQCPDYANNYDCYSLHCCRLGLENSERDYVIVGSHSGYLSIFKPSPPKQSNKTEKPIKKKDVDDDDDDDDDDGNEQVEDESTLLLTQSTVKDLLLEVKLNHPVIGISSGKFITSKDDGRIQLAILHPMKITVYSVQHTDGVAEHGEQSKLEFCFEHKFQRFAFSFCKGNFGGVKGKQFLCIVHINGTLSLFEQEGITYECQLPSSGGSSGGNGIDSGENELNSKNDRNIPTVFCYIPRTDSFVTVSAACELECYRYQDLGQSVESGNPIEAAWISCVGEFALDIAIHQISNDESVIMILGENNFISFSDNGSLKFIKRLDYTPVCFHSFVIGWYWEPNARLMTAIASDHGSILIYEESRLIWSLQLIGDTVPVAISRANVIGLPGALVMLTETGQLTVGYLGSEPQPFKVPPINLMELNYEATQKELEELEKEIRAGVDYTDMSLTTAAAERDLQCQINISEPPSICKFTTKITQILERTDLKQCLLTVTIKPTIKIDQIQLYFDVTEPLKCSQPLHMFNCGNINHLERLETWIYVDQAIIVPNIEVKAIISFINTQSICRVIEKRIHLPLNMFYKHVPPQKEDTIVKLTLSIDSIMGNSGDNDKAHNIEPPRPDQKSTPTLPAIFPEFTFDSSATQALGLKSIYQPKSTVTIVVAKNSNRIRIQSNDFTAIAAVLNTMVERIKYLSGRDGDKQIKVSSASKKSLQENFKIIMMPQIPVDLLLLAIDKHYKAFQEYTKTKETLDLRSGQMRLVQRRLFVKLEDKKPDSLDGIQMLFRQTYAQISDLLKQLERNKIALTEAQINLTSCIFTTQMMVQHLELPKKFKEGLHGALIHPIFDWFTEGWEEMIAPALEMLNHIGPLKKNKNTLLDDNPSYATTKLDYERFKRHLTALLERICRLATTYDKDAENKGNNKDSRVGKDGTLATLEGRLDIQEEEENDDDDDEEHQQESDWTNNTKKPTQPFDSIGIVV